MLKDEKYDHFIDKCFGTLISKLGGNAKFTDIMNKGTREDIDVELLSDCDNREDFLQLRSLERTIENFERGDYL